MDTMIEKIARAIDPSIWNHFDVYAEQNGFDERDKTDLKQKPGPLADSLAAARAALNTLLEPTEEMYRAGYAASNHSEDDVPAVFGAMIQAAIEGK